MLLGIVKQHKFLHISHRDGILSYFNYFIRYACACETIRCDRPTYVQNYKHKVRKI